MKIYEVEQDQLKQFHQRLDEFHTSLVKEMGVMYGKIHKRMDAIQARQEKKLQKEFPDFPKAMIHTAMNVVFCHTFKQEGELMEEDNKVHDEARRKRSKA